VFVVVTDDGTWRAKRIETNVRPLCASVHPRRASVYRLFRSLPFIGILISTASLKRHVGTASTASENL